ncbi:DNA primase family protein [Brachybacterium huguangmaarense]
MTAIPSTWCDPCALPLAECGHTDPDSPGEQHRGQARIAYRFAAANADRLMFVRGLGWFVWDGARWAPDEKDTATTAVLEVLRAALAESLTDQDLRADVRKCETANGVAGVLSIASALPDLRAATDELDADPYLFNCANGTLDLRTRELRPHDPSDRITRVCRGAYDPEADVSDWTGFLASILPDAAERDYLQRVIGQSVFGAVREHLFPVLTGTGANGKGTAYGAITHAMGDYATIIDPSLLMAHDRGAGGPEMMQLFGARLVIGSETEDGKQLDAALMKRLTGGDQITARNLYQPPITWEPTHQLVYVTNFLPRVKGNDPAVWRRLRVIPFDVVVPEDQRDPELPERLKLAADAVLTWAVAGWFDYIDRGAMGEPEAVQRATDGYQAESDPVKRFTQDYCVINPNVFAKARELFAAWSQWAEADGADRLSEKAFGAELDRLGFPATRTSAGNVRRGIGLPAEEEDQ